MRGGVSVLRSTGWALRSKIAIARKGIYFVRYIDPNIDNKSAENKGLFSRFFSSSSDKQKKEQYRVQVKDAGERAEVNVLNKEGVREQSATANRILSLLYEQLK